MSCAVCHVYVGLTSALRKAHAATYHRYPNCEVCPRVFKNVKSFEKHITEPHATKKCQLKTCDELVVIGKELEHASTRHNFPSCVCGASVESTYSNFYKHLDSHQQVAAKCISCAEFVLEWQILDHATTVHGYPKCGVCSENISSNFASFYRHLESHKQLAEKCVCCDELVPDWQLLEHATQVHNYPTCLVCNETISSNHGNFTRHVASHDVESKCPRCSDMVKQKDQVSHATAAHSYPDCSMCSKTFESVPMFYNHVRRCRVNESDDSDDERECPLCDDSICTDRPLLLKHLVEKHSFTGFWCKKCDMGSDTNSMTSMAFLAHISNCFHGKTYDCTECKKGFPSRHRLSEHHCLPAGAHVIPFEEYARRLHGRNMVMRLEPYRLRVEWDLHGYVEGLKNLYTSPARTGATSFVESNEEASRRELLHGGKYTLKEDSRVFCEHVQSVPWIYRLMGTPWELGDSLMPDMKLALVRLFQERPPGDLWMFLVHRLDRYKSSVVELNEVKTILQTVQLPMGTDEQYRDMEHIRVFAKELQRNACRILCQVEYVCDDERLTSRQVVKELKALQRAKRKRYSLPVKNLPVGVWLDELCELDTHNVERVDPFLAGEKTHGGDVVLPADVLQQRRVNHGLLAKENSMNRSTMVVLPASELANDPLRVPSDDACMSFDVSGYLARLNAPGVEVSPDAHLTTPIPAEVYASLKISGVEQGEEWNSRCWEMMYLVMRDFVLYFVMSKSMSTLRLFANFLNEEPTWKDMLELLTGLQPFIERDKASGMSELSSRARMLEHELECEIVLLKNLYNRSLGASRASFREGVELERQVPLFKRQRLHRRKQ